jgi:hypothetical protein
VRKGKKGKKYNLVSLSGAAVRCVSFKRLLEGGDEEEEKSGVKAGFTHANSTEPCKPREKTDEKTSEENTEVKTEENIEESAEEDNNFGDAAEELAETDEPKTETTPEKTVAEITLESLAQTEIDQKVMKRNYKLYQQSKKRELPRKPFNPDAPKCLKLFGKHFKLHDQIKLVKKLVKVDFAVGTVGRFSELVNENAVDLDTINAVLIDWNYRNLKSKRLVDEKQQAEVICDFIMKCSKKKDVKLLFF